MRKLMYKTALYSGITCQKQLELGMYRIAIFKIRPEPDITGYQMNYPAGTGTGYLNIC